MTASTSTGGLLALVEQVRSAAFAFEDAGYRRGAEITADLDRGLLVDDWSAFEALNMPAVFAEHDRLKGQLSGLLDRLAVELESLGVRR